LKRRGNLRQDSGEMTATFAVAVLVEGEELPEEDAPRLLVDRGWVGSIGSPDAERRTRDRLLVSQPLERWRSLRRRTVVRRNVRATPLSRRVHRIARHTLVLSALAALTAAASAKSVRGSYQLDFVEEIAASGIKLPSCGEVARSVLGQFSGLRISYDGGDTADVNDTVWQVYPDQSFLQLNYKLSDTSILGIALLVEKRVATAYLIYTGVGCSDGRLFVGKATR
jgi:hypothetical protein